MLPDFPARKCFAAGFSHAKAGEPSHNPPALAGNRLLYRDGVLERLSNRGFIQTETDPDDGRRLIIALTDKGNRAVDRLVPKALEITQQTLEPLSSKEQELLLKLLSKIS